MAIHLLEPVVPTLNVPRAWPCGAWIEHTRSGCGATPSLLFRRVCFHGHSRDVWLCLQHEQVTGRPGLVVCRDCANHPSRPHRCAVALVKLPEALDLIRAQST